jgi:uncharacterized protein (DUF1330 family)
MAAKGYWIAMVDVKNADEYKKYTTGLQPLFKQFGASYVARAGKTEMVEGVAKPRIVVIEFPSYQAAQDCYASAEYKKLIPIRKGSAEADLIITEGYDGPQP